MKKLIALLVILTASYVVYGALNATITANDAGNLYKSSPQDVKIVNIQDGTNDGTDSIGADSSNYYGPISVASGAGNPMYAGFQIWIEDGLASGDSVGISYQLVPTTNITDTLNVWTGIDTFQAAGEVTPYTDISSLVGQSLFLRLLNLSASSSELPDQIYLMFKENVTYNED